MSSVLDTFYILFESNAEEVEKGTKDATRAGEEMTHGLKKADDSSKKLGASFGSMAKAATAAIAGVFAAAAISGKVLQSASDAKALGIQAAGLRTSVENLDTWGRAIARAGGNAEGFRNGLQRLNADAQQLSLTGESSLLPLLGRLGVGMLDAGGKARNVFDMLPEISRALQGMDAGRAMAIGEQLGFDAATVQVLMQGGDALQELIEQQRKLGSVTDKDAKTAKEFKRAMEGFHQSISMAAMGLGNIVLPALTSLLRGLEVVTQHVRDNSQFYSAFFTMASSGVLALAGAVLATYVPAMYTAAAATLAATWPIIAIIAALAVMAAEIALVYDDYQAFLQGGDSLIGRTVQKWEDFVGWLKKARDFMGGIWGDGDTKELVRTAKAEVAVAQSSPLAAQSSNSIMTRNSRGGDKSVKIDRVEVVTQATDADGISQAIGQSLQQQMNSAIDQFDDGLLA